ncbi:MAG TPA: efflux RND transporter periplasmic adaptor subunit, partial [Steroidobacteraceae bacterium]|nr:efflux RND transporter periplasmic adaptor subunit [Steroidobacteraceae bacterium]
MNTRSALALLLACVLTLAGCGKSDGPPAAESKAGHAEGEKEGDHAEHREQGGHEDEGEGHVELNEKAALAAGIELATVSAASIRDVLPLYGSVHPNAEKVRGITARYPGVITSMSKTVGDAVRQGDVLATVESDESLRTYNVLSTLSGVVTERKANPGEKATDSPLFTIADLSTVWVELSLFSRDLSKVQVGQTVRVKSSDGGLSADGKVVYIASLGQSASQTLVARILIDNRDRRWAPGLYVTGEVTLSQKDVPIAVKSSALQTIEGRNTVFVQAGDGFLATTVDIGGSDGEYTEVISGLDAG